jgi:hypothetical protein
MPIVGAPLTHTRILALPPREPGRMGIWKAYRPLIISLLPGMPGRCNRNAIPKNFHEMSGRRVFDTPRDGK